MKPAAIIAGVVILGVAGYVALRPRESAGGAQSAGGSAFGKLSSLFGDSGAAAGGAAGFTQPVVVPAVGVSQTLDAPTAGYGVRFESDSLLRMTPAAGLDVQVAE